GETLTRIMTRSVVNHQFTRQAVSPLIRQTDISQTRAESGPVFTPVRRRLASLFLASIESKLETQT
ncbi:MAG: hypothetical protein O3B86_12415, partial [Planctomycetota bacterium]|nr:hypothetical protein [Planctomycetota bacterium]